MKGIFLMASMLFVQCLLGQQMDSTNIKLEQYKEYFDKGLINQQDYDLLKAKILHIRQYAPTRWKVFENGVKQYDKKITFEIRIEPVAFFGFHTILNEPHLNNNITVYYKKDEIPNQQYGGVQLGFGAAVKKCYHIHFILGYDGNQQQQLLTIGADFNANLLPGRFAPFIHAGAGYASIEGNNESAILPYWTIPPVTGCYTVCGIGLYTRLTQYFALNISPDYRFLYGSFKEGIGLYNSTIQLPENFKIFYHQIGLRIAAVFY